MTSIVLNHLTSRHRHDQPQRPRHELHRKVTFHDEIVMEDGRCIRVHRKLYATDDDATRVFLAADSRATSQRNDGTHLYALKRITYQDDEQAEACRKEIEVHQTLMELKNENLMPLLGAKFDTLRASRDDTLVNVCYMLFPYIPRSLRDEITSRHLLQDVAETKRRPYREPELLQLFQGIVHGVAAMHSIGLSHRDLKPENILLQRRQGKRHKGDLGVIPILTDFGSVHSSEEPTQSWGDILQSMEEVEQRTTMAYRAPELFGVGLSYGPKESLHYAFSDVWSLGCLLYAIMYGASPFEIAWSVSLMDGQAAEGTVHLVECTRAKILAAKIPFPPLGGAADRRYSEQVKDLVRLMVRKVARERPTCDELSDRLEAFIHT